MNRATENEDCDLTLGTDVESNVVGVTAFGLYADTHSFNASNMVLGSLPDTIDVRGTKTHLLKYPEINVTYQAVTQAVHDIWDPQSATWGELAAAAGLALRNDRTPRPDLVVHLGQMRSFPGYSIEKLAHRDGYERKDLDGLVPETMRTEEGALIEERFAALPAELRPDLDIEAITDVLHESMPDTNLRASTNAGRFSCEYLFYSSLAELHLRESAQKVVFAHVPARDSAADVARGVAVVVGLVRAALGEPLPDDRRNRAPRPCR